MPIHISRGDESSGPYSLEEVQAYLDQGLLLPADLAWQEGLDEWIPLSELVRQLPVMESVPPPLAPLIGWEVYVKQVPAEPVPTKPRSRKGLLIGVGAAVAAMAIVAGVCFGFFSSGEKVKIPIIVNIGKGRCHNGTACHIPPTHSC